METLQKIKTKISASVVGQLYFVALAVMAVPIMLGPTIVLMALGANDMFSQKVRIAGLPSCPPDSYACRQIDGVSIPTPTPAPTEDEHKKALDTIEYPEEEINPEDIPF